MDFEDLLLYSILNQPLDTVWGETLKEIRPDMVAPVATAAIDNFEDVEE